MIAEDADGLRVSVKVERKWWRNLFYLVCLFGWTIGEIAVAGVLFSKNVITADDLFFAVWFIGWTVGGYFLWGKWLWQMWGRRELLVGATTLTLQNTVVGQRRSRTFELARIKKVRAVTSGDGIAFDCDGRTIEFAGGLDQTAQQRIIAAVWHRKRGHI
jgi:hypothetical protein